VRLSSLKGNKPTACFAGTRLESLQAVQRYAEVVSIFTVRGSWVHQFCESNGASCVLVSKDSKQTAFKLLAKQPVAFVVSAGFPYIFPAEILLSGPIFINSHPSLLPAYKGRDAINMAIHSHEEYMGVTVHHMAQEVDAGATIHQEQVWVDGLERQEIYDLLFGIVEPLAITRALQTLFQARQP